MLCGRSNINLLLMLTVFTGISCFPFAKDSSEISTKQKADNAPKVGEMAPTFKLMSLDGKKETDLASFKDNIPVVLFFGSYT